MRRAEWRMRVDDPKTLLGWWSRGFVRSRFAIYMPVALIVVLIAATVHESLMPMVIGILAPILVSWVVVRRSAKASEKSDGLREMLPVPAPAEHCRATVTYRRQGVTTGNDEVVVTAIDGWLLVEGIRSSFALRACDIETYSMDHAFYFKGSKVELSLPSGERVRFHGSDHEILGVVGRWFDTKDEPNPKGGADLSAGKGSSERNR